MAALSVLWICMALPAGHQVSTAQSGNESAGDEIRRGERPPINLAGVPDEAMEAGIIRIKFRPELADILERASLSPDEERNIRFGIPTIDELNKRFGVKKVRQTFYIALQVTTNNESHRRWGFHLWYDLIVSAGTDLRTMVAAYASQKEVSLAEPVFKKQLSTFTPNDTYFSSQWHYHNTGQGGGTAGCDIKLPEAWTLCKGNASVIVAIIDGGIDYNHADLAGNMWSGRGWNFINNNSTIDPHYHGTHVAGTVAANTNNSIGVSGIAGGSGSGDGVRLMSCMVFPSGSGPNGGFENAPVWAADHGAVISQNSWGYTQVGVYNTPVLDAIDYFNGHYRGSTSPLKGRGITFFSAGNSNTGGLWYPGCYSGAFGVAATNNKDQKAYYSNYDTWVDISAPGGDGSAGILSTQLSNSYGYLSGTSMACPHVSGVAALIISYRPTQLTAQNVRDILTNSADNIDALNPSYTGTLGSGRLNAYQALQLASSTSVPTLTEWCLIMLGLALFSFGARFLLRRKSMHEA